MRRLGSGVDGIEAYRGALRSLTRESNERLFGLVEDSSLAFEAGDRSILDAGIVRQYCDKQSARLVALRNDFIARNIYLLRDACRLDTAGAQVIAKIRVHPTNPDLVYVAAFGHHAAPNPERGVYRSKDGGKTWERILFRDDKTGANELIIAPNNPQVLYAALWEAYRNSWEMSSGGPGSGIFKSTDGGDHWTEISRNPGLPRGFLGKIGLSVSGADSNRVYAQIEADEGGFFLTDDGGATGPKVTDRRDLRQRAFYYTRVYADPKLKDTVYVLNVNFHKSTDAGKTWTTVRVPHGDNHDLWISPNDSARQIEANDGGATISVNGGEILLVARPRRRPLQLAGRQKRLRRQGRHDGKGLRHRSGRALRLLLSFAFHQAKEKWSHRTVQDAARAAR